MDAQGEHTYARACAEYKEYFTKHFGEVNTAGDLWVGDFNPTDEGDKLAQLEHYLTQLRKWTKHLSRATVLREEFTRTWITEEDPSHKHWREQMRLATNYATGMLAAWMHTRDEWLDRAIADYTMPYTRDLVDVDPIVRNPEPARSRRGKLTRPKPSRAELARRVALARASQKQRDLRDNAEIMHASNEYTRANNELVLRVCGPDDYDPHTITHAIEEMLNECTIPVNSKIIIAQLARMICDATDQERDEMHTWFIILWTRFVCKHAHACEQMSERCDVLAIANLIQPIPINFYRIRSSYANMLVNVLGPLYQDTFLFKRAIRDAMAFIDITAITAHPDAKDALLRSYVCSWYIMSIQVMEQAIRDPSSGIHTIANKRFIGDDPRNLKPIARALGCKNVTAPENILAMWRDMRKKYTLACKKR